MAKAGMRRPDPRERMNIPKNDVRPVPELQGKAKNSKEKADPVKT